MFFKSINKIKQKTLFELFIYIFTIFFIVFMNGCTTTEIHRIPGENLPKQDGYKILRLLMNDGAIINLENTQSKYMADYMGLKNVIIYDSITTFKTNISGNSTVYSRPAVIALKDVLSITIEKEEPSTASTILVITGAVIVIAVIIGAATSGDKPRPVPTTNGGGQLSCPFVYSFEGQKYVFDAEPYGGAIAEGLKKTDFNKLENLKPVEGKYKLLMKNETDETQHTDNMKLLIIDHPVNSQVVSDNIGNMTVFNKVYEPVSANDETGKNIAGLIGEKDNIRWQTNFNNCSALTGDNTRHELIVNLPRPKNTGKVKLLVNAGTGLWGGHMIKNMLDLYGNKIDDWYTSINNKGSELPKLHNFLDREELYWLKVEVLTDFGWKQKGVIYASSPMKFEDRIVEIDANDAKGDMLTVKLSPPYGFWEIDRIGAIYEEEQKFQIREVPVLMAKNEFETDITNLLAYEDYNYYDMPLLSSKADIYFNVPKQEKNTSRTIYLKSSGYYDIHMKKDKEPQMEQLEKIFNTKGLIVEYSMYKYSKFAELFFSGKIY